jgi:hypothetical protein
MLVSNIVNEIIRMNPDWTQTQVIGLINDIVIVATKKESTLNTYIDPTTGSLPYLSTTAGTFLYSITIPGVSIWKVSEIVVDADQTWYSGYGFTNWWMTTTGKSDRYGRIINFYDKKYVAVPTKRVDAVGTTIPTVTFLNDPGTETTKYQIMAFETPVIISAVSQSISMSDSLKPNLVAAVQTLIDAEDNGRFSEAWDIINTKWLPDMIYDNTKDHSRVYAQNYDY